MEKRLYFSGKSSEKHANEEREKYLHLYNRLNERFIAFERKQLDQMRRILNNLSSDQHHLLTGKHHLYCFLTFLFVY